MELTSEIEGKVRLSLEQATKRASDERRNDTGWTLAIKEALTELGRQLGYKVRGAQPQATPKDYFETGWLWDLTWVELDGGKDGILLDVPLAVESEWSTDLEGEIVWDFQKLLVSRARLRVMIFQAANSQLAARFFERLVDAIRRYSGSQAGDTYLLAAWNYDPASPHMEFREFVA